MNKILNFIKNHIIASVSILVGVVAIVIGGVSFISSAISYSNYEKEYERNKEEINAILPQLPKEILYDNEYVEYDDSSKTVVQSKSDYGTDYVFDAHNATIELEKAGTEPTFVEVSDTSWEIAKGFTNGGSMTFTLETNGYGESDIDIVLNIGEVTSQTVSNLTDYVIIEINGLQVSTVNFALPKTGEYQHLVLKDTHLISGINTLVFKTSVGTGSSFIMPGIRTVTFFTDVEVNG